MAEPADRYKVRLPCRGCGRISSVQSRETGGWSCGKCGYEDAPLNRASFARALDRMADQPGLKAGDDDVTQCPTCRSFLFQGEVIKK